jgi:DNA mismatch repair ATPase MutS
MSCCFIYPTASYVHIVNFAAPLLLDEKAILTLDLLAPSSSSGIGATASSSSSSGGGAQTLLQLLDRAASPAGRRLLRQWITRCDTCMPLNRQLEL